MNYRNEGYNIKKIADTTLVPGINNAFFFIKFTNVLQVELAGWTDRVYLGSSEAVKITGKVVPS